MSKSTQRGLSDDVIDGWLTALGREATDVGSTDRDRESGPALAILARRRLWRRAKLVAAVGCVYLAGLATMFVWRTSPLRMPIAAHSPAASQPEMPTVDPARSIVDSRESGGVEFDSIGGADAIVESSASSRPEASATASAPGEPALPPGVVDAATWVRLSHQEKLTPFERLLRAGELQFYRYGDIAAATRFYCEALKLATDEQLAISDRDNWLLMTLKQSRLREVKHVSDKET